MDYGNRWTFRNRVIEIGLRDGIAGVVDHRDGATRFYGVGEWFRLNRSGIALAHAYHRGELGIESLLPAATIEAMHMARKPRSAGFGVRFARWLRALRPAFSAS